MNWPLVRSLDEASQIHLRARPSSSLTARTSATKCCPAVDSTARATKPFLSAHVCPTTKIHARTRPQCHEAACQLEGATSFFLQISLVLATDNTCYQYDRSNREHVLAKWASTAELKWSNTSLWMACKSSSNVSSTNPWSSTNNKNFK